MQSVVPGDVVDTFVRSDGKDGLQTRWAGCGRSDLGHGEVADAEHSYAAVAPRLGGSPFDEVVHVVALLGVEEPPGACGATGASSVRDDVDIAAGACLDHAQWCPGVLNLARVGRERDEGRESPLVVGSVDVSHEDRAVAG